MSVQGVVNGFELLTMKQEKTKDEILYIRYLRGGKFFTSSHYVNVSEEVIEKVREKLMDYTTTNLLAQNLNETLTLVTIIHEVERIIFGN